MVDFKITLLFYENNNDIFGKCSVHGKSSLVEMGLLGQELRIYCNGVRVRMWVNLKANRPKIGPGLLMSIWCKLHKVSTTVFTKNRVFICAFV